MYCPKCDMDFVDGVTVCTDCGSELVDKEEYLREQEEKANAVAAELEEKRMEYEALELDPEIQEALEERKRMAAEPATYKHQKDKYADNKSSAIAFLIVGVILAALAAIAWLGVIKLGLPFNIAATAFAASCLILALITNIKADKMKGSIGEEDNFRDEVFNKFLEAYTAEDIDAKVNSSNSDELSDEELALEKLNIIQDILTNENDIPDQTFAAEIAEDLYAKLYE